MQKYVDLMMSVFKPLVLSGDDITYEIKLLEAVRDRFKRELGKIEPTERVMFVCNELRKASRELDEMAPNVDVQDQIDNARFNLLSNIDSYLKNTLSRNAPNLSDAIVGTITDTFGFHGVFLYSIEGVYDKVYEMSYREKRAANSWQVIGHILAEVVGAEPGTDVVKLTNSFRLAMINSIIESNKV